MKIIQNFSSKKHIKNFPITDILIGYCGLIQLKRFGHNIKLYCEEKDIDFLKEGGLFELYDEIDNSFLSSNTVIKKVDGENFGSIRKIECIHNEFETSKEPFIYMDVDIIMNVPLDLSSDLLVGSPEDSNNPLYLPGDVLSSPENYEMPEFIKNCNLAFNCGILGFKSKNFFEFYRNEYLKFAINNPCVCKIDIDKPTLKNVWACNAEQRLLTACAIYKKLKVTCIMKKQELGCCKNGIHYYYYRSAGRYCKDKRFEQDKKEFGIKVLNNQIKQMLNLLPEKGREIFLSKVDGLKDLYLNNKQVLKYK